MTHRVIVCALAVAALGLCGCSLYDAPATNPRAIHVETMLRPGAEIKTKNFERIDVKFRKRGFNKKYQALVGPFPYDASPLPDAIAKYKNPVPRFELVAGWIAVVGECPYVETELVDATGHGSDVTIAVQIDGSVHRVYLLRRSGWEEATVTLQDPATGDALQPITADTQKTWRHPAEDVFIEATTGPPTLSIWRPVNGSDPGIVQFRNDVNEFLAESEMEDAPPFP